MPDRSWPSLIRFTRVPDGSKAFRKPWNFASPMLAGFCLLFGAIALWISVWCSAID